MCGTSSSSYRFGTGLGGKKINLVENHAVVAISWEITTFVCKDLWDYEVLAAKSSQGLINFFRELQIRSCKLVQYALQDAFSLSN